MSEEKSDGFCKQLKFRDTDTDITFSAFVGRDVNEKGEEVVRVEFEVLQPVYHCTGFAFDLEAANRIASVILEEANK